MKNKEPESGKTALSKGRTLEERAAELAPLQSFSADAFVPDGDASPKLCATMLGLALAFNDLRELNLLLDVLMEPGQSPPERIHRFDGEQGGAITFAFRILAGVLHEVGELLVKNSSVRNEPLYRALLTDLSPVDRASWDRVDDLARGRPAQKQMDDVLKELRNGMAFHYSAGNELCEAFLERFPVGSENRGRKPLVSIGGLVVERRFYFADAAAMGLFDSAATANRLDLGARLARASMDAAIGIGTLVLAFLERRSHLKPFSEDVRLAGSDVRRDRGQP